MDLLSCIDRNIVSTIYQLLHEGDIQRVNRQYKNNFEFDDYKQIVRMHNPVVFYYNYRSIPVGALTSINRWYHLPFVPCGELSQNHFYAKLYP